MFCKNCGKEFTEKYSKWSNGDFCCKKCSRSFSTKNKRKEINEKVSKKLKGNKPWNTGKAKLVIKICPVCKKEFFKSIKLKSRIYCSKQCYNKDYKHLYRKQSSGGYRKGSGRCCGGYYKNIYYHSTYELAFGIWNTDNNIIFKRCNKVFEYEYKGKKLKYYPDFEINNIIHEIKGYWTEQVDYKTKSVKEKGFEIKILYLKDIKYMIDYVKEKYKVKRLEELYEDYKPEIKICFNCKKEFNWIKQNKTKGIFCSRKCAGLGRYLAHSSNS